MKILIFGVDYKFEDYECKYVNNTENFYYEIIFKYYDILIIDFNYLSKLLEVKDYFKGFILFVYNYIDELIYKKALEVGDFIYSYEDLWQIKYRIKYISKKFLNIKSDVFIFNDLVFNLKTKELYKNRKYVKISPAEKDILKVLIKNKNRFVSKDFILQNSENIDTISSIKVLISKLRKLGFDIENQRELGYKIKIKELK